MTECRKQTCPVGKIHNFFGVAVTGFACAKRRHNLADEFRAHEIFKALGGYAYRFRKFAVRGGNQFKSEFGYEVRAITAYCQTPLSPACPLATGSTPDLSRCPCSKRPLLRSGCPFPLRSPCNARRRVPRKILKKPRRYIPNG